MAKKIDCCAVKAPQLKSKNGLSKLLVFDAWQFSSKSKDLMHVENTNCQGLHMRSFNMHGQNNNKLECSQLVASDIGTDTSGVFGLVQE